jgi:hypothetical protein
MQKIFSLKEIEHNYSINLSRRCDPLGRDEIDWLIERIKTLETSHQGLVDILNKTTDDSRLIEKDENLN